MAEPTVFIPNIPTRYDAISGEHVTALDLNPAARYGRLVPMVKGPVRNMTEAIAEVRASVAEALPGDYLLVVGDVLLMVVAMVGVAERCGGHVRTLRWDRERRAYDVVEVDLWQTK